LYVGTYVESKNYSTSTKIGDTVGMVFMPDGYNRKQAPLAPNVPIIRQV
jgi:hypothetical protein